MVQRKFDAIHEFHGTFGMSAEPSTVNTGTLIPLIMNDDAQGDPMSFNANPEHASWAEQAMPNCYPDSEIRNFKFSAELWQNKLTTGDAPGYALDYGLISCAFPEDLDAIDEKSGLALKAILELQKETTDRQCFPLWNAVDMFEGSLLHAEVPGLTASQVQEACALDLELIRDQRRYGKVKGLLKKLLPIGIRRIYVKGNDAKTGGYKRIKINFVPSNAKFINPYTFLGFMIKIRPMATTVALTDPTNNQLSAIADTTADEVHMRCSWHCQFNERNPEFHMAKV